MKTMATNGRNVRNHRNRSRIAVQNLMEGDQHIVEGAVSLSVSHIRRNQEAGTVTVTFGNGSKRRFEWDERIDIIETPERHRYRRNSLRRNGYRNYMTVCSERATPNTKRRSNTPRTPRR